MVWVQAASAGPVAANANEPLLQEALQEYQSAQDLRQLAKMAHIVFQTPRDLAYFNSEADKIKQMPAASVQNGNLVLQQGPAKLEIAVEDLAKNKFRLNGKAYVYRPNRSIETQVNEIAKLVAPESAMNRFKNLFIPEANAVVVIYPMWVLGVALAGLLGLMWLKVSKQNAKAAPTCGDMIAHLKELLSKHSGQLSDLDCGEGGRATLRLTMDGKARYYEFKKSLDADFSYASDQYLFYEARDSKEPGGPYYRYEFAGAKLAEVRIFEPAKGGGKPREIQRLSDKERHEQKKNFGDALDVAQTLRLRSACGNCLKELKQEFPAKSSEPQMVETIHEN